LSPEEAAAQMPPLTDEQVQRVAAALLSMAKTGAE
jgi:hypothetical protein